MASYVLGLEEIDRTQGAVVGGKAANLGELMRVDGVQVPAGFCVTTDAFRRVIADLPSMDQRLDRLSRLDADDREAIRLASADIRRAVEGIAIPADLTQAITAALARVGDQAACAVRSSATAEDQPAASFAGQQDTYLNIVGSAAILRHISRCWASLFSERAVTYRLRMGSDHAGIDMAVVVQRMAFPDAAGILFTADPVTFNRKVVCVEATFGLGEALVSGAVNPDIYRVREGEVTQKSLGRKQLAIHPVPGGGTQTEEIDPERQMLPALTDAQVVRLAALGRRIEAHFGAPQDVEWCLVDDGFQIVQSRPITTVFPIPASEDEEHRVYLSVGHAQMMTDALKPLGISFWQMTTPRPMHVAGGRLFVEVSSELASPARRAGLLEVVGKSDPLTADALRTILERDFIPTVRDEAPAAPPGGGGPAPIETDPAIVTGLIESSEASIAKLRSDILGKSGSALLDFILADLKELRRILFDPQSHQVFMSAMDATWWLNEHLLTWLGERNVADTLTQSVPNNVTSEMGLALLAVADAVRPHPEVVAFLQNVEGEGFLEELAQVEGGREARDAIDLFLTRYGMRCVGEIDLTRPRWSERPSALVPLILGHVRNFESGAGQRRFEQGLAEAQMKEADMLDRLRALPDGEEKAEEAKRKIDRVRTFIGYREYPKYGMVSRYFVYKQALMGEAERLVRANVLRENEDIFFLTFQELEDVVKTNQVDYELIRQRRDAFRWYQALTPPRVLTSEGEVFSGSYRREGAPPGALVGLAVSSGIVEGRARVIHDLANADLEAGDILVTAYTDPSWSTLLVAVAGLVTEVGGLMSHGSVIAREYGLPAVVGVERATRIIPDGQRIRLNGTHGYVELLD
ncbi:MAG: rifamycin-inactivating phosphotransferase [Candidatus Dormibacteria bacterium]